MFPGARGDHDPTSQINALGQLMDPEVRHRLLAAVEQMRAAGLDAADHQGSGPAILDLRGTPAGEALRASVMQFASDHGAVHGPAPAQIIIDESAPAAAAVQPPLIEAPAVFAPGEASVAETAQPPARDPLRQPSLVEDAGAGGFLSWLSRLLNGREA